MNHTPPFFTATTKPIAFIIALLWLCSCTTLNPVVESNFDSATNFANYRTFAWFQPEAAAISAGTPTYSTLIDQRIKAAVESELLKKGLTPATTSTPDLLLAYDVTLNTETELTEDYAFAPGFGYGYSYWYGYRYSYNYERVPDFRNVRDYEVGTLLIDFIDTTTNELVWRGWSESNVNVTSIGESKISKVVARILAQYPPGARLQQNVNWPSR